MLGRQAKAQQEVVRPVAPLKTPTGNIICMTSKRVSEDEMIAAR